MFNFNLCITNPLVERKFSLLWCGYWSLTKNKTLEFQFNRETGILLSLRLDLLWRGRDHAGPFLEIGILGWSFMISLPDNRHWNDTLNTWYI